MNISVWLILFTASVYDWFGVIPSKNACRRCNVPCFVSIKNPVVSDASPRPSDAYMKVKLVRTSGRRSTGPSSSIAIGTSSILKLVSDTVTEYGNVTAVSSFFDVLLNVYISNSTLSTCVLLSAPTEPNDCCITEFITRRN